jgi:hypothetical protein
MALTAATTAERIQKSQKGCGRALPTRSTRSSTRVTLEPVGGTTSAGSPGSVDVPALDVLMAVSPLLVTVPVHIGETAM